MIDNFLKNLPPVVKNLVLLNVVMFIITLIMQYFQGINLDAILGGYVFSSPYFHPYQIITHFFMHGGFFHIFFNMFALIIFGPILEQVWGPKRFFIFYIACALGAFGLHEFVGYLELSSIKDQLLASGFSTNDLYLLKERMVNVPSGMVLTSSNTLIQDYIYGMSVPVIGASGAVYGVLVGFGYLFPNTELMLLFPPIPIKAKWLVIGMIAIQIYYTIGNHPGDNVAHYAHLGGAIVGFIIVLFWQKFSRNKFY